MTNQKFKTYFNWSSGKDAALALYHLQRNPQYEVKSLVTTVNEHYDRVTMHGLRADLLDRQIESMEIPSMRMTVPENPSMEVYEQTMIALIEKQHSKGFTHSAFGDIFLQDLREYREKQFENTGIKCIFPIWKRNTKELIHEFLDLGFKAVVVCIKSELLDTSFAGREISHEFLNDLPDNVDPCGENGEFHTFCYDGPIFKHPVKFELGEKIFRSYKSPKGTSEGVDDSMGFWFQDLVPNDGNK